MMQLSREERMLHIGKMLEIWGDMKRKKDIIQNHINL